MIDDVWLAVGAVSEFCVQVLQMSSDLSSDAPYKEHADPLWLHDGRCQVTVVKKYPPLPKKKMSHIKVLWYWKMARCCKYKYLQNLLIFLNKQFQQKFLIWMVYHRKLGMEDDEEEEEAFMEEDDEEGGGSDTDGEGAKEKSLTDQKLIEERTAMLIAYFFFSMVWSVGATLDANSRAKFDEFFKGLCDMDGTTAKYPRLVSLLDLFSN